MQETVQEINFDDNTIYSDTEWQIKKMFAVPETNDGKYTIPGEEGQYKKLETLSSLRSIDWGINHCVIVDNKNRVYSMGQKSNDKLGLAENDFETVVQAESEGSCSDPINSEEERQRKQEQDQNREKLV